MQLGDSLCAICLGALSSPEHLVCGHKFCRDCINGVRLHCARDFEAKGRVTVPTCPLCRTEIPGCDFWLAVSVCEFGHGNLASAAKACLVAIGAGAKCAGAYYNISKVLQICGKDALAEEALRAALNEDPQYVCAHVALGLSMLKRGNTVAATLSFQDAMVANPQFTLAYVLLGFALCNRQEYSAAEIAFHAAIDAGSYFLARCGLVHVHKHRGDTSQCLEYRLAAELQRPQWELQQQAGTASLESFFALDRFDYIMDAGAGGWSRPRAAESSWVLDFFLREMEA